MFERGRSIINVSSVGALLRPLTVDPLTELVRRKKLHRLFCFLLQRGSPSLQVLPISSMALELSNK